MPTSIFSIPEIINGNWSGANKQYTVPNTCSKCGTVRGTVKRFKTPTYGSILRAKCPQECDETYEELRLQSEAYNAGKTVNVPKSFFKGKMEPWKPDTRVGSVPSNVKCGMNCSGKHCNEWFDYVGPNQPNGKFLCRSCRSRA